jgi:3-hydroxyacyl-[acyl-carrier-protein] dehydratase
MEINQIKKLLHHREPYLMVSRVIAVSSNSIHSEFIHRGDEAHISGHFPGTPIVPGAMLQEICTQSAGILITKYHCPVDDYDSEKTEGWALGVLNKVEYAKYLEIVKPNEPIEAKVELIENIDSLFKFSARILQGDKLKAKLKFNLVNISDSYITE